MKVMLGAGLRVSELTQARRENYVAGRLLLTDTKGAKPRVVYLSKPLQRIVEKWMNATTGAWLFGRMDGEKGTRRSVHRMVARAGELAGITGLHPHMLRRTYGSITHARGAPLKFVQQQFGHSSIITTMQYIDIDGIGAQEIADEYADI